MGVAEAPDEGCLCVLTCGALALAQAGDHQAVTVAIAQASLADIADDWRSTPEARRRAEAALDAMTVNDTLAAGLAADFGEVCMEFIRVFDVDDHDIAKVFAHKERFIDTLRTLFSEASIYCKPEDGAAESAA